MSKELSTEKTMTVKELAGILGLKPRTIQLKVKELFPRLVEAGKTTYLNEQQATEIKLDCEKKFAVKTDIEMMEQITDSILWLKSKVDELESNNKNLQIELDQEKAWYSVKRIKNLGLLPNITARSIWSPLKRWCIENDYQIKTIFDANYGNVKTYHADAWNAVYNLDLYYRGK